MGWERFLTFTGWPVASKMVSAYRSTKPVQPGQTIELLTAIESPTTTRDQGVGDGMDVSVAGETGVEAGAQPLNRTARKASATRLDLIDSLIEPSP
jgi:hypothetical protein